MVVACGIFNIGTTDYNDGQTFSKLGSIAIVGNSSQPDNDCPLLGYIASYSDDTIAVLRRCLLNPMCTQESRISFRVANENAEHFIRANFSEFVGIILAKLQRTALVETFSISVAAS